jgi:Leucine-rich repeat (LRR) protein
MPDNIPHLTLLKEARLYNNQISSVFHAAPAAPCIGGNLRVLRLINNHVTAPLLNIIAAGCPLIEELALSHNRISLLQGTVCSLAKLQRLLLHSNRISDIGPEVNGLTSLDTLILTENRLIRLPPQLCCCQKLQVSAQVRCQGGNCDIFVRRCCRSRAIPWSFLPFWSLGVCNWCDGVFVFLARAK